MPTNTLRGNDPQHPILSAVRESQTAFIDVVRSWTDITEQFTRRLSLPVAGIDVVGGLDRTFYLAEQTPPPRRRHPPAPARRAQDGWPRGGGGPRGGHRRAHWYCARPPHRGRAAAGGRA